MHVHQKENDLNMAATHLRFYFIHYGFKFAEK